MARQDYTTTIRKIILILICAVAIVVIFAVVCSFLLKPERQIQLKFEALANNYYENVFYENMLNSENYSGDPEAALQKYTGPGLPYVTLRDLILISDQKTIDDANYLLKYCDENKTHVIFHPESPYSRTDYRSDYTYSCNF